MHINIQKLEDLRNTDEVAFVKSLEICFLIKRSTETYCDIALDKMYTLRRAAYVFVRNASAYMKKRTFKVFCYFSSLFLFPIYLAQVPRLVIDGKTNITSAATLQIVSINVKNPTTTYLKTFCNKGSESKPGSQASTAKYLYRCSTHFRVMHTFIRICIETFS